MSDQESSRAISREVEFDSATHRFCHPPSDESPSWHALLAPLPRDAMPQRRLVASPEVLPTPDGASIAGWESLVVELSAGAAGLRVVLVTLDGTGQPLSAGDTVLSRMEASEASTAVRYRTESIGGRLEPDGTFHGTHWRSLAEETEDGESTLLKSARSQPNEGEVRDLRVLVADVIRRAHALTRRS